MIRRYKMIGVLDERGGAVVVCRWCGRRKWSPTPLKHWHNCHGLISRIEARLPKPGNVLKQIIHNATRGKAHYGLDCEHWRQRLNALGWSGCWSHRAEIWERLKEQAAKEGYSFGWRALPRYAVVAVWHWLKTS